MGSNPKLNMATKHRCQARIQKRDKSFVACGRCADIVVYPPGNRGSALYVCKRHDADGCIPKGSTMVVLAGRTWTPAPTPTAKEDDGLDDLRAMLRF